MKKIAVKATLFLAILTMAFGHYSCNRKSDAWTARTWHKMLSKYNPYFNGEQAYIEGVANLEKNHKDDYDEILSVYRWGSADQLTLVSAQMDRAIEKGAKVIQSHSMMKKGKQQNIYIVKSYLLIGKARFYKGDYFPALETFNYIIQQYSKDKKATDLVADAQIWAGRCQLKIGNPTSANAYFDELYNNKDIDKSFRPDVSASMAQAYIDDNDFESAVANLTEAMSYGPKKQARIRWTFIRAQLNERLNNNYESSQDYKAVIDMKPNDYDMLFTAQLNRAKNFDVYMENSSIVYKELERMLEDEKNIEYRDQIYYVMAQVAINEEEWEKAEEYLKLSVRASTKNNNQKGMSYLGVADINFDFKEYIVAQSYYDSAATTLPAAHKKSEYAKKRQKSLTALVDNLKIIELEDSLQVVARMSPEEQRKLYSNYIEWLRAEEDRIRQEKELAELNKQLIAQSQNKEGAPAVGQQGSWYFYNANTRASGLSRFQSKWGVRKLEDNWRQKNKMIVAVNENENGGDGDSTKAQAKTGGKYEVEYYLSQIPDTRIKIDTSNARIEKAYLACGDIYREQLEDFPEATKSYNKLLERFPESKFEPRVLYSLYRMYINQQKEEKAEPYKTQLVQEYPSSVYTQMIVDPGSLSKNSETYKNAAALYEKLYKEYKKGNYKTVQKRLSKEEEVYRNTVLEPKFELLRTMCLGKQKKNEDFIDGLKFIIEKYPNTKEAILAKQTLDLADDGSEEAGGGDPTAAPSNFVYNSNSPHKFVAILPNQGVNMTNIRNAFADFNTKYFKLERLQIQNIFLDQDSQLIIVSGLKNAAKAKVYYNSVSANQSIMGYLPPQSTVKLILSDENYKELYKTKKVEEYLKFLKAKYQIEESI